MVHIERPKSLNELVLERLRKAIIEGDYGLGDSLSELRIATDFGTSKGPVRRAIVQLQMENLVRVVPQSGTFVFSLGSDEVYKLNESRLIFETSALKLAMAHDPQGLADTLANAHSGMLKAMKDKDVRSYLSLDTAFHEALFTHCGNIYIADAYRLVSGRSAALRTHLASTEPQQTYLSLKEHGEISEAVAGGDLKAALKTLRIHIGRAPQTYKKQVDDIAIFDRNGGRDFKRGIPHQ